MLMFLVVGMLSFETVNLDLPPAQPVDAVSESADGNPSEVQIPPEVDNDATDPDRSDLPNDNAEKRVIVQDVGPGTVLGVEADVHRGCVCALAYSPNGLYVASGFEDAAIIIWDASPPTVPSSSPGRATGVLLCGTSVWVRRACSSWGTRALSTPLHSHRMAVS